MEYLIERLLCADPQSSYNDVAKWNYHKLPEALGCVGWLRARVSTCGDLDQIIRKAEESDVGGYIEVVTDRYAAPDLPRKLHDSRRTLYA